MHDILELERRFIAEPSGKKRYKLRIRIEALEEHLTAKTLKAHNNQLREALQQSHGELLEVQALAQQLQDAMRTTTDAMEAMP